MSWPDVEGGLRDYLRADTAVAALVGNRVFFGIPDRVAFPLVTVTRTAGADDPSTAPIDRPVLTVNCWGRKGNRLEALNVANAVHDALVAIAHTTSASTFLYGASVIGNGFFPIRKRISLAISSPSSSQLGQFPPNRRRKRATQCPQGH